MVTAKVSEKGQLTLPAAFRRNLGIAPNSRVELELGEDRVIIRPIKSIAELAGIFNCYARGKHADWDAVRDATEAAVAEEVAHE